MRNAELAVYRGQLDEAEAILLQANPPMVYRAVKLNIRAGRWLRALEIAQNQRAHVDTVVAYRQRYLQELRRTETLEPLRKAAASVVAVDWPAIKARKDAEKAREASGQRGGVGGRAAALDAAEGKGEEDM
jgi:intraflagellar transport protein 80